MSVEIENPRDQVLAAFNAVTGLNATGLRQRGRDRNSATFELLVDGDTVVPIGTIKQFWSRAEFTMAVIVALGRGVREFDGKPADWHGHVQAMIVHVAAVEDVEDEPFHVALAEYLAVYARRASTDREGAAIARDPFREADDLYVHATAFAGWLRRSEGEQVTRAEVLRGLRQLGAHRTKVDVGAGSRRTSISYYRLPISDLDDVA